MSEQQAAPSTDELLAHAGWLKRLAERLVGTGDGADDLVQETWLAALRHGPRRGKSLRPWLATVLRNFAVSSARTGARRSWREEQHARPEALPSTEELTARAEASRTLVEAVLALPENQRVVVLLRYFEQLPTPEIAARLGCPTSTVRSHLSRAVERLRSRLDQQAGGDRESWVRCLAPLPAAIPTAPSILGALVMSNAAKLVAVVISVTVIGVGLWSALDETEAVSPGPAEALDPAQVALVDPEPPAKTMKDIDEVRLTIGPTVRTIAGAASLQGVLLDPRSGEPVPWFALGVVSGTPREGPVDFNSVPNVLERFTTDEQGRFGTLGSYGLGEAHLIPLEDWERFEVFSYRTSFGNLTPRPALAFANDADSLEPGTVELESGPTYRIHCPQAEAIGLHEFSAVLSNTERPWRGLGAITHVIDYPVPLIRFLPLDEKDERRKLDTLHLLSDDQQWAGWARVGVRPGLSPDMVEIDLFPCGTLRVDVRADSTPPLEDALLTIWEGSLDSSAAEQREALGEYFSSVSIMPRASGPRPRPAAFAQRYMPIGSYTIRVRSSGCADHLEQIELRQGEQRIEVVLTRTEVAVSRIDGRVVPRSGRRPAMKCIAWCQLTGDDSLGSQRTVDLDWTERDGRWSANFAFENLLDREYRVWITRGMRVSRDVAGPNFEPRDFRVPPGGPPLEFELFDPPPARRLEVLVEDSATGEPLAEFHVAALLPATGKEPEPVDGVNGLALVELRGDLEGGQLWVSAPGYAPLYTELSVTQDADGVLHASVRLDPGWGAPVQVMILDGEQREPAAGVEVLADDHVVGKTDETGVLWLSLAARPDRLTVRGPGLLLQNSQGPIDASGRLKDGPIQPMQEVFFFILRRDP